MFRKVLERTSHPLDPARGASAGRGAPSSLPDRNFAWEAVLFFVAPRDGSAAPLFRTQSESRAPNEAYLGSGAVAPAGEARFDCGPFGGSPEMKLEVGFR
jgi:hypothetical protein